MWESLLSYQPTLRRITAEFHGCFPDGWRTLTTGPSPPRTVSDYTARNMRLNLLVLVCLPILTVPTHAQWDLQDSHTTDKRTPEQATLLEAVSKPRCYGLDCPPWPTPPNIAFCFRAGDRYYVGTDRSWGVPWANKARKLQNLKGESVKILVTDKEIMVVDPQVRLRLWIAHQYRVFSLDSCNHT